MPVRQRIEDEEGDRKEMSTEDWARYLCLKKRGHFTAKDILQEEDPKKALGMPCEYPGCRTKTRLANSNLCRAHSKRMEEAMNGLRRSRKPRRIKSSKLSKRDRV